MEQHDGQCLCGAVTFTISSPLSPPDACHCSQCRRQSGHYWAATTALATRLHVDDPAGALRWFQASAVARRGFCATCGSFLFWERLGSGEVDVAMGALNAPTGLVLRSHIFVADKGDYYDIADGLPQRGQ
jgi:hypothetical protein